MTDDSDYEAYLKDMNAEPEPPVVSRDRYTVSGNSMRIWRLDPQGNPVGEAVEVGSVNGVSFDLPTNEDDEMVVTNWDMTVDRTLTLDIEGISPEVWRLLTGQPYPSRWLRFKRFIKRWRWTITGAVFFAAVTAASAWWLRFLWRKVSGE